MATEQEYLLGQQSLAGICVEVHGFQYIFRDDLEEMFTNDNKVF